MIVKGALLHINTEHNVYPRLWVHVVGVVGVCVCVRKTKIGCLVSIKKQGSQKKRKGRRSRKYRSAEWEK